METMLRAWVIFIVGTLLLAATEAGAQGRQRGKAKQPAQTAAAGQLEVPEDAATGLAHLYRGDPDRARAFFHRLQHARPEHPLGYLLEVNTLWWKTWCAACQIQWNMIDAWKRDELPEDRVYFALADKAVALAEAAIKKSDTAEMRLYAGMGWALRARLHGLRDERRPAVRAGVRAREHLLRAARLDPQLADAYTGLGLYNYYVDTLSPIVKLLRVFMGIPGGSKREGLEQLERAMREGRLTAVEARFYLAKNLRNYDRQYARAVEVLAPLVEQYPQNPLFQLLLGDLHAKLGHTEEAAKCFRAAQRLPVRDAACAKRVEEIARAALAALPAAAQ